MDPNFSDIDSLERNSQPPTLENTPLPSCEPSPAVSPRHPDSISDEENVVYDEVFLGRLDSALSPLSISQDWHNRRRLSVLQSGDIDWDHNPACYEQSLQLTSRRNSSTNPLFLDSPIILQRPQRLPPPNPRWSQSRHLSFHRSEFSGSLQNLENIPARNYDISWPGYQTE